MKVAPAICASAADQAPAAQITRRQPTRPSEVSIPETRPPDVSTPTTSVSSQRSAPRARAAPR